MAQSVEHETLGFSSGHDLAVGGFESHISADPAWDSLSLSLPLSCPSPLRSFLLSLKINK